MKSKITLRRLKVFLSLASLCLFLVVNYSNCAPVAFQNGAAPAASSAAGELDQTGSLAVGATGANPPLDLFFIVDNSASMYANQVRLAASFNSVFQSNLASLSNFDVNVYLFSTASTVALNSLNQVATRSPSSITSVPSYSDLTSLLSMPGSIYAYWNNTSGIYGTAPFSAQFNPAPVVAADSSGHYHAALSLSKQGTQTAAQYQAAINSLSKDFQARLAYLNPNNQFVSGSDPVSNVTDISSGLCSTARILKHSSNFIQPGDAAAFIIVSDDDDRLNDRNPANNQCVESVIASNELVNGSCGHYQANYAYETSSTISYQDTSKFTYVSGTNISYSYPTSASCQVQYRNGYTYAYTYTALKTTVTYTKCAEVADGFCVNPVPNSTYQLTGNYVASNGACLPAVSGLVPSPASGTAFSCAAANVSGQKGSGGVDVASNGTQCSAGLVSQLSSVANQTFESCTILGESSVSKTVTGQPLNSCSNFCNTNGAAYPECKLLNASVATTQKTLSLMGGGLSCNSQCPSGESAKCGVGTIASYITANTPGAVCGASSNVLSYVTVQAGVLPSGNAITCNSALGSVAVQNSSGAAICQGASTVDACIESLQPGGSSSCLAASGHTSTVSAPLNVSCTTACSNSNGFCPSGSATVANYLAQTKAGLCLSSAVGGPKQLAITFKPAFAQNASCSSLCSNAISGSCDGMGYGASGGLTVANYVASLGGGATCTSSVSQILSGTSTVAQNSNPTASCTDPTNPVFFASGSPYAGSATTYVAGDSSHLAADFQKYIVSQSTQIFGLNLPVVAVIGHLSGDSNLGATDVGGDYFNLAQSVGSAQVSSVTASDYSSALSKISNFIVQKSQNSFVLGLPANSTVYAVSVEHQGSQVWTSMPSNTWTWNGQTLSVAPGVTLTVGDQLMYQYKN